MSMFDLSIVNTTAACPGMLLLSASVVARLIVPRMQPATAQYSSNSKNADRARADRAHKQDETLHFHDLGGLLK